MAIRISRAPNARPTPAVTTTPPTRNRLIVFSMERPIAWLIRPSTKAAHMIASSVRPPPESSSSGKAGDEEGGIFGEIAVPPDGHQQVLMAAVAEGLAIAAACDHHAQHQGDLNDDENAGRERGDDGRREGHGATLRRSGRPSGDLEI